MRKTIGRLEARGHLSGLTLTEPDIRYRLYRAHLAYLRSNKGPIDPSAGTVAGRHRPVCARKRPANDRRRHAVPDLSARTRGEDRRLHASLRVDGGAA
jgi:hypothetical protein